MDDAWWMPGVQLPGEELEGRPLSRVFLGERALPHSSMVNSSGRRFGFYGGAGGTISLGLVFGHLAGQAMARREAGGLSRRRTA